MALRNALPQPGSTFRNARAVRPERRTGKTRGRSVRRWVSRPCMDWSWGAKHTMKPVDAVAVFAVLRVNDSQKEPTHFKFTYPCAVGLPD